MRSGCSVLPLYLYDLVIIIFMELIFFLTFETPLAVIGTRFFGEVQRVSVPSETYISRGNMDKFLSKFDENWN